MTDSSTPAGTPEAGAQGAQDNAPVFNIEKLYVRDLSLEVPGAPESFRSQEAPQINVQFSSSASALEDGFYEVLLKINVEAKLADERTLFMVEVEQAGIFQIHNIPEADLEPVLMIGCPNILYPYAREVVSDATVRAGFQPVLLAPVNFEQAWLARKEQEQQQQQVASNGADPH